MLWADAILSKASIVTKEGISVLSILLSPVQFVRAVQQSLEIILTESDIRHHFFTDFEM